MGIDVIRCGCAGDGVVCLCSGKYPQNRELVCYCGKQTMSIRNDLVGEILVGSAYRASEDCTYIIQFEA